VRLVAHRDVVTVLAPESFMHMSRRLLASAALVTAVGTSTACMGQFALTKMVYGWNDKVTGNKIVNNLVFWGLGIFQIYDFTVLGDLFIFNVIEFWTGSNVLADAGSNAPRDVVITRNDDGSASITKNGDTLVATPLDERHVRLTKNGTVVGMLEAQDNGAIVVFDARGLEASVITPEEVQAGGPVIAALAR
jgi:hypothetical protein